MFKQRYTQKEMDDDIAYLNKKYHLTDRTKVQIVKQRAYGGTGIGIRYRQNGAVSDVVRGFSPVKQCADELLTQDRYGELAKQIKRCKSRKFY